MFRWLPRWAWAVVVAGLVGAHVVVNIGRPPHFDAAWFAEEAWWLVRDGRVRSEFFRGLNGWETQMFVFHKLFVYVEAVMFRLFGPTPAACQSVALGGTALGLAALLRYLRSAPTEHRWLAATLYLGCGALLRYGGVGRPEALVMALGFGSFVVLAAGRGSGRTKGQSPGTGRLLGAGVLAGAAALTHLNGLIFIAAGVGWLALRPGPEGGWRRWRPALLFGAVGGATAALYLLDAAVVGQLPTLVAQFRLDPATRHGFDAGHRLATLARLHTLFFHSEGEAGLSGLAVLGALALRRYGGVGWHQPATRYALLLLLAFAGLTKSPTDYYYLLFVPSLVAMLLEWLEPAGPPMVVPATRRLSWGIRVALAGYLVLVPVRLNYLWNQRRLEPPDTVVRNAALARWMPRRGALVIAPLDFFFGQITNYRVRGLTAYFLRNEYEFKSALSVPGFFELAAQDSITYVITDLRGNMAYLVPADAPPRVGEYHRVFQDAWGALYVRE